MAKLDGKLPPRAETILCAIIDSYFESAAPVGSECLRKLHNLPWSSATIRNEMAAIESRGLLTNTHTSSGRIPTAKGMRYFVDYLLESTELKEGIRRRIIEEFDQANNDPMRLVYIVSQLLSRLSKNVSVVQSVYGGGKNFVIAGKENFLGQPEFSDSLKLKDFFRVLEEEEVQDLIFRKALTSRSVHVLIGAESVTAPYQELFDDVSVVAASFGMLGRAMGTVGIVGPKRMDYRSMIPLVDFTVQSVERKLANR
jgi:heat-inducible transcriptional repressor